MKVILLHARPPRSYFTIILEAVVVKGWGLQEATAWVQTLPQPYTLCDLGQVALFLQTLICHRGSLGGIQESPGTGSQQTLEVRV